MLWDEERALKVVQVAMVLHNLIVESRRNGYESELYTLAEDTVRKGFILEEIGSGKAFVWFTRPTMKLCNVVTINDSVWAKHIAAVDYRMKDDAIHFSLKRE